MVCIVLSSVFTASFALAIPPPVSQGLEADGGAQGGEHLLDFELPAQPLASALEQYGRGTRQSTLFRSELVAGKVSAPLYGRYTAAHALNLMLVGTGLVAQQVDSDPAGAFVIGVRRDASAPATSAAERLAGYPAVLQASVWKALCADVRTLPGEYRALLSFSVDSTGRVAEPQLLAQTGDPERDAAILGALSTMHIGIAPPPGLPQPLSILVQPRMPGSAQSCGGTL